MLALSHAASGLVHAECWGSVKPALSGLRLALAINCCSNGPVLQQNSRNPCACPERPVAVYLLLQGPVRRTRHNVLTAPDASQIRPLPHLTVEGAERRLWIKAREWRGDVGAQDGSFRPTSKEDVAWLGTDPIPAKAYYDAEYFDLEREAVFKRVWLQVGHVCELPDAGCFVRREIEVANASVLIVRGRDGEIRAFHNVCTHRGTQLVDAQSGKQSTFSCPYHMWTYGHDGSLISAPDFESFYLEKAQCSLKQIALDVFAGLIFIHLGKPEKNVRQWLGGLAEKFEKLPITQATCFVEYSYEINANWKVAYDNFQENYHLRFVHPRTGGPGCTEENPFAYPARYNFDGPHRTQTIWTNPKPRTSTKVQAVALQRITAAARKAALFQSDLNMDFMSLFPNFTLFGLPVRHFTQTIMPLSVDRCRGVVRFYWVGEEASASERFAREYVTASQRDIHVEDRDIVERGQQGLASGALEHINFQVNESLCRHLFNQVDSMVESYKAELHATGEVAR